MMQNKARSSFSFLPQILSMIFVTLLAHSAFAIITVTGITNASAYTGLNSTLSNGTASASATPSTQQGQITIFGGVAGSETSCNTVPGTSLCDNCAASTTALVDCNSHRLTSGAVLTITFNSSTTDGVPAVASVSTDTTTTGSNLFSGTTSITHPGSASVQVAWSAICPYLVDSTGASGTGSCIPPTKGYAMSGTIHVGILASTSTSGGVLGTGSDDYITVAVTVAGSSAIDNSNATVTTISSDTQLSVNPICTDTTLTGIGICHFAAYPGDTEGTIRDVRAPSSFPITGLGISFAAIRVFASTTSFDAITSSMAVGGDIAVTAAGSSTGALGSPSLSSPTFTGLSNGSLYYIKIGMVDQAGNVGFYTSDMTGASGSDQADTYCDTDYITSPNIASQCHEVAPAPVYGVLGKSVNCFIATAAYGSAMAPQVATFREFRNRFLLTSQWGKSFVHFYYEHSPKYAKIISENEFLRAMARLALWPILAFVSMTLKFGIINTLLILLAAILMPTSLYILRQNRGSRA